MQAALEHVSRSPHRRRVLELGVGSGCVLLSCLREQPELVGVGIDISSEALELARANAEQLGLSHRVQLLQGYDRARAHSLARCLGVSRARTTPTRPAAAVATILLDRGSSRFSYGHLQLLAAPSMSCCSSMQSCAIRRTFARRSSRNWSPRCCTIQ